VTKSFDIATIESVIAAAAVRSFYARGAWFYFLDPSLA